MGFLRSHHLFMLIDSDNIFGSKVESFVLWRDKSNF
jgi:hypothetical protein